VPINHSDAQARGAIGGLTRAALAPDRTEITRAARAARWQKYTDQVRAALPDLTDEAEITRRAELLRSADMRRLSLKASTARRRAAKAQAAAEVSAAEVRAAIAANA
jgi:hypothetical protein